MRIEEDDPTPPAERIERLRVYADKISRNEDVQVEGVIDNSDEAKYACPRVFTTVMHWPWEPGTPIPFDDGIFETPDTLKRPAFFRNVGSATSGINSAARKLVAEESQSCPFCRARFRNPAAMKLHIRDQHDAMTADWMFPDDGSDT